VAVGDEPRRRAVLDVADLTVGTDHAQLARLLAAGEEPLPGAVDIDPRLEEVFEPTTAKLSSREAEQSAGGRIDVDERPRIVDDQHGVTGGREERLGLFLGGHLT